MSTKSIRFKIISITVITLVVALALTSAINYYQSRSDLEKYMENTISTLASSISSEVGLWLESCRVDASTSALALVDLETEEEKLAFMNKVVENNSIYETVFLADENGDYIITEGSYGNIADRAYFQEVMLGSSVVADPVVSRATEESVIVVASPLLEGGEAVGLLGITVALRDLSELIVSREIGQTGYPYLVQGDGLIIAHPDQNLTMSFNTITDDSEDEHLREAMLDATAGNSGISRYVFEGIDKYVAYEPVADLSWAIAVTVPVAEMHEQLSTLPITFVLIAAGIALFAALISNLLLTRTVTNPLQNMQEIIKTAADGNLVQRGAVSSEDEIGRLTADFNHFIDNIHEVIKNIQDNSSAFDRSLEDMVNIVKTMSQTSEEMNTKTMEVNTAAGQITSITADTAAASSDACNFINSMATAIEEMHSTIQNQAAYTQEISASLEHVSTGVNQFSSNVEDVSVSARDMSESVNSVASAVKEINDSLSDVSTSCERSSHITDDAERKTQETKTIIENLNHSSRQIGKIVDVIYDIADQTNMLALNAAIEAAGAGEAGRGFAVVANEVKELAKQTAEATEEIGQQIETMQNSMKNAVSSMETITEVIEESNNITGTIASAVAEQSAATDEISNSIVLAAEKVKQITENISGVAENIKQVAENTADVSTGVNETAHSTNQLAESANEVAENAVKASEKVSSIASESEAISKKSEEIATGIESIFSISSEGMKVVKETGDSAHDLALLFKELEEMSKQFTT